MTEADKEFETAAKAGEGVVGEMVEALRAIIGNANEAPQFGPFDQIDNDGGYYQSEAFAKALGKGRTLLAKLGRGR